MKTTLRKTFCLFFGLFVLSNIALAQLQISFTASDYNGFNISCNRGQDGWITVNVTGGTPPYSYSWSNGEGTQTISNLAASYYAVHVTDATMQGVEGGVNLNEPLLLAAELTSPVYPNGYNVSCFQCFNGSITTSVEGGVTPYSFLWEDGNTTTQNRTSVGSGGYNVQITDANGCIAVRDISLTEPARDDWTMTGNTGSNPPTQYIGTADNKDLVFKTNATERLKISGSGNVQVLSNLNIMSSIVFGNNKTISYATLPTGLPILGYGDLPNLTTFSVNPCIVPVLNTPVTHQFSGSIQLYGINANTSHLNVMNVGFDGANAIIDATGDSPDPYANRLLLNYYCGKDVIVGNGSSGDLTASMNLFVNQNVGIGINTPSEKVQLEGGNIYVHGEGRGIIVDEGNYKRTGFMKYTNHRAGIWRTGSEDFEIGRVGNTLSSPSSFTTDFYISGSGNIGIGTTAPTTLFSANSSPKVLHIKAAAPVIRLEDDAIESPSTEMTNFEISNNNGAGRLISNHHVVVFLDADNNDNDEFFSVVSNAPALEGNETALFKVNKDGVASARAVKVTLGGFPDYVFEKEYSLRSIKELKEYITVNKHLPGIPAAEEVIKDGLDVGEMNAKLLEKIEELTLYVIDLQNQLDELKKK